MYRECSESIHEYPVFGLDAPRNLRKSQKVEGIVCEVVVDEVLEELILESIVIGVRLELLFSDGETMEDGRSLLSSRYNRNGSISSLFQGINLKKKMFKFDAVFVFCLLDPMKCDNGLYFS